MPNTSKKPVKSAPKPVLGNEVPRVHTKLRPDLPSKGQEMIDFVESLINPRTGENYKMLPWQKWLAIEAHRYNPETGKWQFPEISITISRQNGKSEWMIMRILTGMFKWSEPLQVGVAHKLTTSSEIFYKIFDVIDANPKLQEGFIKKIESKGSQELKTKSGRYIIRANNSASRGISAPSTIFLDEVREYHDMDVWSSLRYTQMASRNPMCILLSNAGDQHSIVLNKMKERAYAAIAGSPDNIAWFEWSGIPDTPIDRTSKKFWESIAMANPSLGYTIDKKNIEAVLSDDESIIRTEVLCNWVSVINPVINPVAWNECKDLSVKLSAETTTWMAIDLTPDRKAAALVAAQKLEGDEFVVALLHTWFGDHVLDDKMLANEIAKYVRQYETDVVAYSAKTSAAVASRLRPAGIQIEQIDGALYAQSCDEMLSAIQSKRLKHMDQEELSRQALSAIRLPWGDGGWIMGRRVSNATIAATVAMAMVSHYATTPESGDDIVIM